MNKFRAVPPFIPNYGSWKTTGIASGSGSSLLSVVFTPSLTLTHVGMVRCPGENHAALAGSPHLRGDGPYPGPVGICDNLFSPPAWGWSASSHQQPRIRLVLPTYVGMVRWGDIACCFAPMSERNQLCSAVCRLRLDGTLESRSELSQAACVCR